MTVKSASRASRLRPAHAQDLDMAGALDSINPSRGVHGEARVSGAPYEGRAQQRKAFYHS
jgi:hypothetical protein